MSTASRWQEILRMMKVSRVVVDECQYIRFSFRDAFLATRGARHSFERHHDYECCRRVHDDDGDDLAQLLMTLQR